MWASGSGKQCGSIMAVKISKYTFNVKCFYCFSASLQNLLYELGIQEKPHCHDKASEGGRQQHLKKTVWFWGEALGRDPNRELTESLGKRTDFSLPEHRCRSSHSTMSHLCWCWCCGEEPSGAGDFFNPFWIFYSCAKTGWVFGFFPTETTCTETWENWATGGFWTPPNLICKLIRCCKEQIVLGYVSWRGCCLGVR